MQTISNNATVQLKVPLDKYCESVVHKTLENWQETGQDDCIYTLHNEMHLLTK